MNKAEEILQSQQELARRVDRLQSELMALLGLYVGEFDYDGELEFSDDNFSNISQVDVIVDSLSMRAFTVWMGLELTRLINLSKESFLERGYKVDSDVIEKVKRHVGIKGNKVVKGGYLDSITRQKYVKTEIKNYVIRSLGEGKTYTEFIRGFRDIITGGDGLLQKYYRTFAHDVFAQIVRITDSKIAQDLGLEYFIYSGGLIETSRQFCIKKDGLVFHRNDAEDWRNDPDLPGQSSRFEYNPLTDLGRWNCRHYLEWIDTPKKKQQELG